MRDGFAAGFHHDYSMLRAGIFAFAATAAFCRIYLGVRREHFAENAAREKLQRGPRGVSFACGGNDIADGDILRAKERIFEHVGAFRYIAALLRLRNRADAGKAEYFFCGEIRGKRTAAREDTAYLFWVSACGTVALHAYYCIRYRYDLASAAMHIAEVAYHGFEILIFGMSRVHLEYFSAGDGT